MASYNFYQPNPASAWTIKHNLDSKLVAIDVFKLTGGSAYEKVQPSSMTITDTNTIKVIFGSSIAGRARIVSEML